jgi:hypothetical protein
MLVGVCDFPGSYAFPPAGYGGIERWLWAASIPAASAALGLSAPVRSAYAYWSLTSPPQLPWPDVCQVLEGELAKPGVSGNKLCS